MKHRIGDRKDGVKLRNIHAIAFCHAADVPQPVRQ